MDYHCGSPKPLRSRLDMKLSPTTLEVSYVRSLCIATVVVVLVACFVACAQPVDDAPPSPPPRYNLTIFSTAGGLATAPGEGRFTYDAGTVVELLAIAEGRHRFTGWEGNVNGIADIEEYSTTITMNNHYTVVASFVMEIWDWYDLHAVREATGSRCFLMNGLDYTTAGYAEVAGATANGGRGWQPIGTAHIYPHQPYVPYDPFTGTFDGQGYEISDLFIDRPDENGVGLFGFLDGGGTVQNLRVVNACVTAEGYVGGLVGWNHMGTVTNSYFSGIVSGGWGVGGLVGANRGTVGHSSCSANVTGGWGVGGLTGDSFGGALIGSHFAGSVTGEEVGGLVGWNAPGSVSNSHYNYHEVLLNGQNIITIGALSNEDFDQWLANGKFLDVGQRLSREDGYYIISNVRDFKELLSFGQYVSLRFRLKSDLDLADYPGVYIPYFAGEFDGNGHRILNLNISLGFFSQVGAFGYVAPSGIITRVGVENATVAGNRFVGGLVGANHGGTVRDSYAIGGAAGGVWYIGGLMGDNRGTVSNCYSNSSVKGEMWVGGLVGGNWGAVSNCFWDVETSGMEWSAGGTGKTVAEMKDITTFSAAGWSIAAVAPGGTNPTFTWNIVDGQTYPFLSRQSVT